MPKRLWMTSKKRRKIKNLSLKKLLQAIYDNALVEENNIYWNYIAEIHYRGRRFEFEKAKELLTSKDALWREIGADILGQLGYKSKSFIDESVTLLLGLVNDENEDVIRSVLYALGHRYESRCVPYIVKYAKHKNKEIRHALAVALGTFEEQEAIEALIILCQDEDFDTRNWATFSLGRQCETNTEEIRDTLYENLKDEEKEVRGEALLGLALRKDMRVKEAIIEDLKNDFYGSWVFSSIVEMPDKEYMKLFETYILTLDISDKKAFKRDIEEVREVLNSL